MSILVEHRKRRREILERALEVIGDRGFESATFQKVADRCGLNRATLYLYFRNKREILYWGLRQLLAGLEAEVEAIGGSAGCSQRDKLSRMVSVVVRWIEENRRLLAAVLGFLIRLPERGADPGRYVRRRILPLRRIVAGLVADGVASGEIPAGRAREVDDLLMGLIESALYRLAVLGQPAAPELVGAAEFAVGRICRMSDPAADPPPAPRAPT
jgi:AcrR family transcriptional regulator